MPKPSPELPDHQVSPNPKLEKYTRRQFSTEYKLRSLAEADACQHGELGQLLRREKLYSSQLTIWRKELAENENARLQQRLSTAEDCLSLQKKALAMLDRMNNGNEP